MATLLAVEPVVRLVDNPILRAQAVRRLRPRPLMVSLVTAGSLAMFVTMGALLSHQANAWYGVRVVLLIAMGVLLLLRAPSSVAAQMGEERTGGMLEFHRATPVSPWTQVVGFVLGSSARDWAITALLVPFYALACLVGPGRSAVWLWAVPFMFLSAVLYQLCGMLVGLVGNPRGAPVRSSVVMMAVVLMLGLVLAQAGLVTPAHLTPIPALMAIAGTGNGPLGAPVDMFGVEIPAVVLTLLVHLHAAVFVAMACARRLRRGDAPVLSRRSALALMASVNVLMVGGAWTGLTQSGGQLVGNTSSVIFINTAYLAGSTLMAAILAAALAPTWLDCVRNLRRARRQGRPEVGWRDDGGWGLGLSLALAGISLAGMAVAMQGAIGSVAWSQMATPATALALVASGGLVVLCSGLVEHSRLVWRGAAGSKMWLVTFCVAVVPLLAAALAGVADQDWAVAPMASLSPLFAGGAMLAAPMAWANQSVDHVPYLAVSTLVALCLAVWFQMRIASQRAAMAQGMTLDNA